MALAIYVPGPTMIQVDTANGGTYVDLGMSDNDNLPSISFTDHRHEVKTVASGAVAEEIVMQNTECIVTCALVKWDQDILTNLLTDMRGALATPVVGRRLISSTGYSGLRIRSIAAGQPGYTFTHAFLRSDSVNDSQWGNRERVLTLNFHCIPNPTNNTLYTYANI
jgi:hypothetical protein